MSSYATRDDFLRSTLQEIERLARHANHHEIAALASEALRVFQDPEPESGEADCENS